MFGNVARQNPHQQYGWHDRFMKPSRLRIIMLNIERVPVIRQPKIQQNIFVFDDFGDSQRIPLLNFINRFPKLYIFQTHFHFSFL